MSDSYIDPLKTESLEKLSEALISRVLPKNFDIKNSHFQKTPERWLKAINGYAITNADAFEEAYKILKGFGFVGPSNMILVRDIYTSCLCPHHLFPVSLKIDFAYIPALPKEGEFNSVGLSKIPRFIRTMARRIVTQEELNNDIVLAFKKAMNPQGCICTIVGKHTCMIARGVESRESDVITSAIGGQAFEDSATRAEFFSLLK